MIKIIWLLVVTFGYIFLFYYSFLRKSSEYNIGSILFMFVATLAWWQIIDLLIFLNN